VALVTGAGGAIGGAVAARLADEGYAVACADADLERAEAGAAGAEGALAFACDVRSAAEVEALRAEIDRRLGEVQVLVNAAGVFFTHRITELAEADWDLIVDVNLKGTFLLCRAFLPALASRRNGRIVNVSSLAGTEGGRERAAYCATKAGVILFSRSLALDHGHEGVRVNCVCPGLIDTPMAAWLKDDPEVFEAWQETVPAGRIGTVGDVADAVAYLVSPGAEYVQGASLVVDGGFAAGR
jgi:NAD(P)-dependent dehydrogenase (short-subunit alcohol dehydrogenase family)